MTSDEHACQYVVRDTGANGDILSRTLGSGFDLPRRKANMLMDTTDRRW